MKNPKSNLKIMTIVGTRPELIRLSRVIARLDSHLIHKLVHTGQNYDYELNEVFFKELELPRPDHILGVETTSLGKVLGETLIKIEPILSKENPDAVLILGDTNSCIAAIMAKRFHIPIYHMEAGNRSFDLNVPEEINRRIIDHISDFNLVYTENSRRHLLSEGLPHRRIYLTGSPMNEVLQYYSDKIDSSKILDTLSLKSSEFFVVSMHREENVDNIQILKTIVSLLNKLAEDYGLPVIVSTHPRTRKRLLSLKNVGLNKKISLLKPFGFFDYVKLQKNALCVISDSGTISEESAILDFPAVTLRNSMERPEALDAGTIILTGFNVNIVMSSIKIVIEQHKKSEVERSIPNDYLITNTSERVLNLIMGTSKLSHKWAGIS